MGRICDENGALDEDDSSIFIDESQSDSRKPTDKVKPELGDTVAKYGPFSRGLQPITIFGRIVSEPTLGILSGVWSADVEWKINSKVTNISFYNAIFDKEYNTWRLENKNVSDSKITKIFRPSESIREKSLTEAEMAARFVDTHVNKKNLRKLKKSIVKMQRQLKRLEKLAESL